MTRRSEQGNVIVFVIVGVLLTAALVGSVFAVRHFQKTNSGDNGATPVTTTTDKAPQNEQGSTSTPSSSQPSSSDQALKDALAAQSQAEKDRQAAQQNNAPATTAQPATGASHLPQTGPESSLLSVLGVSLVAGTGFAYLRSRRLI